MKWTQGPNPLRKNGPRSKKKVDAVPKEMDSGSELNGPSVQSNEGQGPRIEGQGPNGILEPRVQISRVQIKWNQGPIKMDPGPNKMGPEKMDPGKKWTQIQIKMAPKVNFLKKVG